MAARGKYGRSQDGMQEYAEGDVLREMVRTMVQEVMEEELTAHLGAEAHERTESRRGYRNGHKERGWKTRVGELQLAVPQSRGTEEPYHPSLFGRWERSERAVLVACAEMYFMGVSTRKVGKVLEEMSGFGLSAATVSRVAAELDETLRAFRSRPLDGQGWPYLIVDARYEKVRRAGRIVSVAVLIVAGINEDGRREILTWRVGDSESEAQWREVFAELKRRGLKGVEMLVSDDHKGIRAAADRELGGVEWQRCRVHFIRNILKRVSHKSRRELERELSAAFRATEREMAMQAAQEVADRWRERYPRVAELIEEGFEQCLAVNHLPASQRRRLHSTNMIERVMREVKRRTRTVGIFPNVESLDRLTGAVLIETDEKWQCEPMRYMTMEKL